MSFFHSLSCAYKIWIKLQWLKFVSLFLFVSFCFFFQFLKLFGVMKKNKTTISTTDKSIIIFMHWIEYSKHTLQLMNINWFWIDLTNSVQIDHSRVRAASSTNIVNNNISQVNMWIQKNISWMFHAVVLQISTRGHPQRPLLLFLDGYFYPIAHGCQVVASDYVCK